MNNRLLLLLLALFGLACHQDSADFGVEPGGNAYNDEASPVRKVFCNSDQCDSPGYIEQYTYNASGKLVRMDQLGRNTSGKLEIMSYTEYTYNSEGQLAKKIRFGKYGAESWTPYDESEYEYAGGVLKTERLYFNQRNPERRVLTGRIDYDFKDGKKVGQRWFDANQQFNHRVEYEYNDNVIVRETWYSNAEKVSRYFTHSFAGNRRQIGEYIPNRSELIALIEKTYDKRGRLSTEETKVNNPLLCVMTPGVVRYEY